MIIQLPIFLKTLIIYDEVFCVALAYTVTLVSFLLLLALCVDYLVQHYQASVYVETSDAICVVVKPVVTCLLLVGVSVDC
jgi:hypothetical protein